MVVDVAVKSLPPAPYGTELLGCLTLDLRRPLSQDAWHTLGDLPGGLSSHRATQPNGQIRLRAEVEWFGEAPVLLAAQAVPTGGQYLRGLLRKQKPGGGSWKLRWFVQFEDALCYFEPGRPMSEGLKGRVELKQVTAVAPAGELEFLVHTASRVFTLRAPDARCREYWVRGITLVKKHLVTGSNAMSVVEPGPQCPYVDASSNNFLSATAVPGVCHLSAEVASAAQQTSPGTWDVRVEDSLSEDATCSTTSSVPTARPSNTTEVPVLPLDSVTSRERSTVVQAQAWCAARVSAKLRDGEYPCTTQSSTAPRMPSSASEMDTDFVDVSFGTPETSKRSPQLVFPQAAPPHQRLPSGNNAKRAPSSSSTTSSLTLSFAASPDSMRSHESSDSQMRRPFSVEDDEYGEKAISPPLSIALTPPPFCQTRSSPRALDPALPPPPPKSQAPPWPSGYGQPPALPIQCSPMTSPISAPVAEPRLVVVVAPSPGYGFDDYGPTNSPSPPATWKAVTTKSTA